VKAVLATGRASPDALRADETADPVARAGQVLVEVAYAGVNFADVLMARGESALPFPFVPGVEGSGRVVAVGAGVDVDIGTRVAWAPVKRASSVGSYAELAVVGAEQLLPVPDDVSLLDAAAITLQGLTAHYLANEQHPLVPGTTVLVHAAAGGTGRLVVQWAKHLGATVLGTTSTADKATAALGAGADHVILYTEVDFVDEVLRLTDGAGVDYIVDGVGQGTFRDDLRAVADRGRICVFGRAAGPPERFSPIELVARSITVSGGYMTNFLRTRDEVLRKADELWSATREGWLRQELHSVRPFTEAHSAHEALGERRTSGKLILEVAGGD
jgi:NADPH:quinone reductase